LTNHERRWIMHATPSILNIKRRREVGSPRDEIANAAM